MPVRIAQGPAFIKLEGDGSVTTEVTSGRWGVVPMLVLSNTPGPMRAGGLEFPLRVLAPSERLVGVVGNDDRIASQLFPGQTVIKIRLDPTDPMPGSALAWEVLDAVVLEAPLDNRRLLEFVAGGTIIAVRSNQAPDPSWPWRKLGDHWVLDVPIRGPIGSIAGETAYLPAEGWRPGHEYTMRLQLILAAMAVLLLIMGSLLMQRWLPAMVVVTIICIGGIEFWRHEAEDMRQRGGPIVAVAERLQQRDRWRYSMAPRGGSSQSTSYRPILIEAQHAASMGLVIYCRSDGANVWIYYHQPWEVIAAVDRSVSPISTVPQTTTKVESPLRELARKSYLDQGMQILGEIPAERNAWAGVVVGTK